MAKEYKWNRDLMIPFDPQKGLITYGYCVKVPNFEFSDALRLDKIYTTRSSAKLSLTSIITGLNYDMYVSDINPILSKINKGVIKGTFAFNKKGSAYSLKYIR